MGRLLSGRHRRRVSTSGSMGANAPAERAARACWPQRDRTRTRSSTLSQRLLRGPRANLPNRLSLWAASQSRMKTCPRVGGDSPTGEPDAGKSARPVRREGWRFDAIPTPMERLAHLKARAGSTSGLRALDPGAGSSRSANGPRVRSPCRRRPSQSAAVDRDSNSNCRH